MSDILEGEMPINKEKYDNSTISEDGTKKDKYVILDDVFFNFPIKVETEDPEVIHDENNFQVFEYSGLYKNKYECRGKRGYEHTTFGFTDLPFANALEIMREIIRENYGPHQVSSYDDCYYNLSNGKYVFIKEQTRVELHKSQAMDMLLYDIKDPKAILQEVPRRVEVFDPSKKTHFMIAEEINAFNLYSPSKYVKASKPTTKTIPANIDFLLNHLISDEATKTSLINALAHHLKTGEAIHLGWIFVGVEGAGKGTIMHVIEKVFGMQNFQKSKLMAFTGDKIKGAPNKLICYVDESADHTKMYEVAENLKAIIGNNRYASRALHANETTVKNYAMFFFTVNSFGFKLSAKDRRFNIIECKIPLNKAVDSTDMFYEKINSELQLFTDYLLNYEVNIPKTRKVVETSFRKKMINDHLPVMERIARVILENSLETLLESIDEDSHLENIEKIGQILNDIHHCGSVTGTVIASLSENLFNLIDGIDKKYYKKNTVTSAIKNKWDYSTKKVDGTATKAYIIDVNNDKHYGAEEYETSHFS